MEFCNFREMAPMDQTELALLRQYAQTRDAFAFRELVEQHQDMVFATCHRVLGNHADAEDAAQDCFLKLAQAADRLKAPIGGWLHTVAVRSAIDLLRGETARRRREHAVARPDEQAPATPAPWDDVCGEVDAAITALPERLRTPIVLYFLEYRTQADVAAELGISRPSVSKRLRRGVEALRRQLKRAGIVAPAVVLTAMLAANTAEAAPATLMATLGKVALAGTSGVKATAATAGGMFAGVKIAAALAVAAGAGAGALAIHQATRPPHPAPIAAAPVLKKEALTTETVLDAVLTLPTRTMSLGDLHKLVKEQLGVYIACHSRGRHQRLRLEPGKHAVRDVLKAIAASTTLTTEVSADRDRVVLCLWRTPDAEALAEMMKLAASDDVVERCTAARWLPTVGGRDALVQLLKLLADPDARVRYFASRGIVAGWPSAELADMLSPSACVAPEGTSLAVAKAIDAETWRETRRNMFMIARSLRDPRLLPALKKQLAKITVKRADNRTQLRASLIINTIGSIGGPDAEAILLETADKSPEWQTRWAVSALGRLGTDAAVARLSKQIDAEMKKEKREYIYFFAGALAKSDNPAAARKLIQLLKHPDLRPNEATTVTHCLIKFNPPEAQAACLEMFRAETDPNKRLGLGKVMLHIPAVRQILSAELTQGGAAGRMAALTFALRPMRDPGLVPVLIEIIGTDDKTLQADGAGAVAKRIALTHLGRIGSPEAEKALIQMTGSTDATLRRLAFSALGNIDSPTARKLHKAGLKDLDAYVRTGIVRNLTKRPDAADIDLLLATASTEPSKSGMVLPAIWRAIAAIGNERAVKELLTAVAKGNTAAAGAITLSTNPLCVRAVRDVLAGDDVILRGRMVDGLPQYGVHLPLSTYYAVSAALAGLPGADERLKTELVKRLGPARDPRGNDALAKLLIDEKQSLKLRLAALSELNQTDPAIVEPMLHVVKHATSEPLIHQTEARLRMWGVIPPGPARKPRPPKDPAPKDPPDEREFPPPPEP